MGCPEGLVVEVLVNWVGVPTQTVVKLKLAEGMGKTSTSVVALFVALPRAMVQVYVPAMAMVQFGRVGFC